MPDVDARLSDLCPHLPHHLRGSEVFREQVFKDDADAILTRVRDMFDACYVGTLINFEQFSYTLCGLLQDHTYYDPSMKTKAYYVRSLCIRPMHLIVADGVVENADLQTSIEEDGASGLIAMIGQRYNGKSAGQRKYSTIIMCSSEEDTVAYALRYSS